VSDAMAREINVATALWDVRVKVSEETAHRAVTTALPVFDPLGNVVCSRSACSAPEIKRGIITWRWVRIRNWIVDGRIAVAVAKRIEDVVNSVSATAPSDREHAAVGGPVGRRRSRLEGEVGSVPLFTLIDHVIKVTISRQLTIEILAGRLVSGWIEGRLSVQTIGSRTGWENSIVGLIVFARSRHSSDFGFRPSPSGFFTCVANRA